MREACKFVGPTFRPREQPTGFPAYIRFATSLLAANLLLPNLSDNLIIRPYKKEGAET